MTFKPVLSSRFLYVCVVIHLYVYMQYTYYGVDIFELKRQLPRAQRAVFAAVRARRQRQTRAQQQRPPGAYGNCQGLQGKKTQEYKLFSVYPTPSIYTCVQVSAVKTKNNN